MERNLFIKLEQWKNKKKRKPLIIQGACVKIGLNQEKPYK